MRHDDANPPVWHESSGRYLNRATGAFLPTWDDALDAISDDDEPLHVARLDPGSTLKASCPDRGTRSGVHRLRPRGQTVRHDRNATAGV
ncbi:MAG: hypothetical protein ACRDNZ_21840 [Streptosporangiaceae bacterium]